MNEIPEWLRVVTEWAWARHHNILSWYIRPLFFIPFSFFAYRRNLLGIILTVVALLTSFAWFPAPEHPSPAVEQMLKTEQDYLLGEWTVWKVAIALLVPLVFTALAMALWRRSVGWGLAVINGAVLFKIFWTFWFGESEGALAHLVPAGLGLIVVNAVVIFAVRWLRRRGALPSTSAIGHATKS